MARSASASDRARAIVVAVLAFGAPVVACRAFVDLDGLGGGTPDATTAADVTQTPDTSVVDTGSEDVDHPTLLDSGGSIIDASTDVPEFDVDASTPCPGTGGPTAVRVATSKSSFCIDSTEVTRAQYQAFLATNPSTANQGVLCAWNTAFDPGNGTYPPAVADENLPAGFVDWCDAQAFCKWAGKRLCGSLSGNPLTLQLAQTTEAEFVFACTGAGTRTYSYGNTYDDQKCNGGNSVLEPVKTRADCQLNGVYDLAGNTHEWIDACVIIAQDPPEGQQCVIHAGAYDGHPMADMACTAMGTDPRNAKSNAIGFRCCSN